MGSGEVGCVGGIDAATGIAAARQLNSAAYPESRENGEVGLGVVKISESDGRGKR